MPHCTPGTAVRIALSGERSVVPHPIDERIEDLPSLDSRHAVRLKNARASTENVRHPLCEEEEAFFKPCGSILGATKDAHLARRYRRDRACMLEKLRAG
jgi:hypothetical protein